MGGCEALDRKKCWLLKWSLMDVHFCLVNFNDFVVFRFSMSVVEFHAFQWIFKNTTRLFLAKVGNFMQESFLLPINQDLNNRDVG